MNKLLTIAAIFTLVLCSALATSAQASSDQDVNIEQAKSAAQSWLQLVDSGAYGESWEEASEFFRNSISTEKWEASMVKYRTPLGSAVYREFKNAEYKTSLPSAPDGEYVIIQFDAFFENKAASIESVTPKKDSDGVWRVAGYFIK